MTQPHLLLISDRVEDRALAEHLSRTVGLDLDISQKRDEIRRLLVTHLDTVVLWDAEAEGSYEFIGEVLPKYVKSHRLYAITDKALAGYTHLLKYPFFGHHLRRRFQAPAHIVYPLLVKGALNRQAVGLSALLPEGTATQKIRLLRSAHKKAAIEAIQNHLTRQGIRGRVAALVAQATDELILNAIFDAPLDNEGEALRHSLPRDTDFDLTEREQVQIELGSSGGYMGVSVKDQFGTLKRRTILSCLNERSKSAGLGLYKTLNSGLSLVFSVDAKKSTDVTILFPQTENYKDFRESFHFLSVLAD